VRNLSGRSVGAAPSVALGYYCVLWLHIANRIRSAGARSR